MQKVSVSLKARVIVPDGVLVRELEGESVLLNINTENYFGLDEIGTRMWSVLSESSSVEQAVAALLNEYAVDHQTLVRDISELISQLLEKELIELVDE